MLGRGPPGAPPTLPNFDARNRTIGPISMRGCTGSDMLDGGREWLMQMGQIGCPVDCARALKGAL